MHKQLQLGASSSRKISAGNPPGKLSFICKYDGMAIWEKQMLAKRAKELRGGKK